MSVTVLHGCDQSGPTAARPAHAPDGFVFFDTTLNLPLVRDEAAGVWRDMQGNLESGNVRLVANAGAPVDGTNGTGAGVTGKGSLCIDTTNAVLYINTGTKASPTWTMVGLQTS